MRPAIPSSQWRAGIACEIRIDILARLGCLLLRIGSSQLTSLNGIRIRVVTLRWNRRFAASGREYIVFEYFHWAIFVTAEFSGFLQSRFSRRDVALRFDAPINHPPNRIVAHRTQRPHTELRGGLWVFSFSFLHASPTTQHALLLALQRRRAT